MYSTPIADVIKSTSYEEAFMAEDRIVRNDVLAVGILGLVILLVASVITYNSADPAASQTPTALLKIYQPDQLVYPANATIQNAGGRLGAWTCLLYTSPSPRDATLSRMPSSA